MLILGGVNSTWRILRITDDRNEVFKVPNLAVYCGILLFPENGGASKCASQAQLPFVDNCDDITLAGATRQPKYSNHIVWQAMPIDDNWLGWFLSKWK